MPTSTGGAIATASSALRAFDFATFGREPLPCAAPALLPADVAATTSGGAGCAGVTAVAGCAGVTAVAAVGCGGVAATCVPATCASFAIVIGPSSSVHAFPAVIESSLPACLT